MNCRVWTGKLDPGGYGRVWFDDHWAYVHRLNYEAYNGPIRGEVDHLCRNRACYEITHLEDVTSRENTLRGTNRAAVNARKIECIHGHPFDAENTKINARGERQCRTCLRAAARRYRERVCSQS